MKPLLREQFQGAVLGLRTIIRGGTFFLSLLIRYGESIRRKTQVFRCDSLRAETILYFKNTSVAVIGLVALLDSVGFSQDRAVAIPLTDRVQLNLVYVPGGEFNQGSPNTELGRKGDESLRRVKLTSGFLVGKYPVTVGEFKAFVADTMYKTEAEQGKSGGFGFDGKELAQRPNFNWLSPGFVITDEHPVCLVTVNDAMAFLSWLNKKTNRNFSLPTEAQWEYACRAGAATRFSSGDNESDLDNVGWYKGNSGDGTRPVGKKKPNAFGIYDMTGNVFEWCSDVYGDYANGDATDPNQRLPNQGDKVRNVLRGGSWLRPADNCRSAARYRNDPRSRNADNGFRVCCLLASELDADSFIDIDHQKLEGKLKPKR